jgi:hypothetical protein
MKTVFVPASDQVMNDKSLVTSEFVPFNPDYLSPKADRKPRNWITPSSYEDAMARLRSLARECAH